MNTGRENRKAHGVTRDIFARGHLAPTNPAQKDLALAGASIEEAQQPPSGPEGKPLAGQKTWNIGVSQIETDRMTPEWRASQGNPQKFPPGCANQNTPSTDAPYDGNPYTQYSIVFTVYNATGYDRNDYYVVMEAGGNISAGTVNSNFSYRRGWFNNYNTLAISPSLEGAELLQTGSAAPSPGSWQSSAYNPSCETSLTLDIEINVRVNNGYQNTPFSATFGGSTNLPDWAVSQTIDGNTASWMYYQIAPWAWMPPWTAPNWDKISSNGYGDGDLYGVSQTSLLSMSTYSVAAWRFDQSLVSKNGALPVQWNVSSMTQGVCIVWNVHGWNGTSGLMCVENAPQYSEEIDLSEVVSRGSWEA